LAKHFFASFYVKCPQAATSYRAGFLSDHPIHFRNVTGGVNYIDCKSGVTAEALIISDVIAAEKLEAENVTCGEVYCNELGVSRLIANTAHVGAVHTSGMAIKVKNLILPSGDWRKSKEDAAKPVLELSAGVSGQKDDKAPTTPAKGTESKKRADEDLEGLSDEELEAMLTELTNNS
jgi:hypothetical protein